MLTFTLLPTGFFGSPYLVILVVDLFGCTSILLKGARWLRLALIHYKDAEETKQWRDCHLIISLYRAIAVLKAPLGCV
ncbi:hypothetical protein SRHO_G00253780 [Serrasalmus rhombeus]